MNAMDEYFMKEALRLAKKAAAMGEVPVGALIVKEEKIIARGYNRRERDQDGLAHAELLAIRRACRKCGSWRLDGCTLYVTLEPCPMCAGAIVNTRIPRVVIGARDPKGGAMGGAADLMAYPWNHHPECRFGVLEEECGGILRAFFKELRRQKK
ncbi:MAG: tRNA-specific adenosine deaminase [Clostridiales bacterium]|nr:MAG: tRNA-specific adenosine deaminase [Clostridiales bacterium]